MQYSAPLDSGQRRAAFTLVGDNALVPAQRASEPRDPLPDPNPFSTEAVHTARVNVTCVTPLGEDVASTS
jgi:hypothetical protein